MQETFRQWWEWEGSGIVPTEIDDIESHTRHVASEAWIAASAWVPVEYMLPPPLKSVAAYDKLYGTKHAHVDCYGRWSADGEPGWDITHWQPLPGDVEMISLIAEASK